MKSTFSLIGAIQTQNPSNVSINFESNIISWKDGYQGDVHLDKNLKFDKVFKLPSISDELRMKKTIKAIHKQFVLPQIIANS